MPTFLTRLKLKNIMVEETTAWKKYELNMISKVKLKKGPI